jgi:hypothetical protein
MLFLHVMSAALLVGGAVVAGAAQIAALQRERPSEIALLLYVARYAVIFVGLGLLGTLGFGFWLADYLRYDDDQDGWSQRSRSGSSARYSGGSAGGRHGTRASGPKNSPLRATSRTQSSRRSCVTDRRCSSAMPAPPRSPRSSC